jgi:hypothetical protein
MKLQLPSSISSQQDLKALIVEIREYSRWFSHNAIKQRVNAKHAAEAPILTPAAKDMLREWSGQKAVSEQSLDELIKVLQTYASTAPSLTITLAAPPTAGLKQTLVAWCRSNVAPDILVSFQFNSTLLGGMVVRYGSRVFDWSFRRQILNNSEHFPEVLRRV